MVTTTLAQRLKTARKAAGLSQGELARRIGISRAAVSQWENGTIQSLDMANLFAVADLCNINARWLALGTGTPTKWINLSPDEKHLVELFQAMPEALRGNLISIAVAMPTTTPEKTPARPYHAPPPAAQSQKVGKRRP